MQHVLAALLVPMAALLQCAKVQHIPNLSHTQVRVMICDQVRDTEKNVRARRCSVFTLGVCRPISMVSLFVRLSTTAVPLSRRPWKTLNPCLLSPCDLPICVRGLSSLSLGPSRSCSFPRFLLCASLSPTICSGCVCVSLLNPLRLSECKRALKEHRSNMIPHLLPAMSIVVFIRILLPSLCDEMMF